MVEIRYDDQYEIADLAGQTVSEVREQFKADFGIPDKARAKLNGRKIKKSLEPDTVLNDDDKLSFAINKSKGAYLVGALLLALAVTGSIFAYGFVSASTTIDAVTFDSDFASVTVNKSDPPTWEAYGFFKGSIDGPKPIFDVDTATSGYTGDLVVTVSIANADELVKAYRALALKIDMVYSDDTLVDINEDGTANATNDYVLLTLGNGSVDMFPGGSADVYTVRVQSGFYATHIWGLGGWDGKEDPQLYCEVAQR
jgi:molybdopterin converting factor small subunit